MKSMRFGKTVMLLCRLLLLAVFAAVFFHVFCQSYASAVTFAYGRVTMLFLYTFVYFWFLHLYGGLDVGVLHIRELVFSNAVTALLTNFVIYFVMAFSAEDWPELWPLAACLLVQVLVCAPLYTWITRLYHKLYPQIRTLFVYSEDPYDRHVASKLTAAGTRFIIDKSISEQEEAAVFATLETYEAVVLGNISPALRTRIMDRCFINRKQCFIIPQMQDIMLNNAALFQADDAILYMCRNRRFTADQLLLKRLMDIGVSLIGLVIACPFMGMAALAIKLEDGGPVLYRQTRLTRGGKQFELIKFRSMTVNAEQRTGAVRADENDPRITRVGRFIRACRIDELPQLINILSGDMSLVGPRPERPELFYEACKDFPQFAYRLKVKAGLTGYAQLRGKYNTTFEDKVRLDLLYIEKASLLLDLQLLFYTIKVLFMKDSTAGMAPPDAAKNVPPDKTLDA